MFCRWMLCASLVFGMAACSDEDPKGDAGAKTDGKIDLVQRDSTGDKTVVQKDLMPKDQAPDQTVLFETPVTLRHDTGLPIVQLHSFVDLRARTRYDLSSTILPFEVHSLDFVPASAFGFVVSIHADQGGLPGVELGKADADIKASDVDKWFSVDFKSQNIRVTKGPLWVVQTFKPGLPDRAKVSYGAPDTGGNTTITRPGFIATRVNFEQLQRVRGATSKPKPPGLPGKFGDACAKATDCESGYCSGGKCSKTCTANGDCGSGGECREMAYGPKVCVTKCTTDSECESTAQCLTNDLLFTANLCVLRGPVENGQPCNYQYHTICQSGRCTACESDPVDCNVEGTCMAKP